MKENEDDPLIINEGNNTVDQITQPRNTYSFICLKSVMVIGFTTFLALNTAYGISFPTEHPTCIKDVIMDGTSSVNTWFQSNPQTKNVLLIISSLSLDIIALIFSAMWTIKGATWRPVFSLILYYVFRIVCLFIYQIRIPDGFQWTNPGFPSIFVSYTTTNDFFYSSFLGVALILALEFQRMKEYTLYFISLAILIFQTLLLFFLRGAYFIDVAAAVVFAHYVHMLMDDLCGYLEENKFLSLRDTRSERDKIDL